MASTCRRAVPGEHDVTEGGGVGGGGGGGAEVCAFKHALQISETSHAGGVGGVGRAEHGVAAAAAHLSHEQVEVCRHARAA
jgi:hypothetical protein